MIKKIHKINYEYTFFTFLSAILAAAILASFLFCPNPYMTIDSFFNIISNCIIVPNPLSIELTEAGGLL